jgi:hypothetical protein
MPDGERYQGVIDVRVQEVRFKNDGHVFRGETTMTAHRVRDAVASQTASVRAMSRHGERRGILEKAEKRATRAAA